MPMLVPKLLLGGIRDFVTKRTETSLMSALRAVASG
jgi:hypothetical protein